MGAASAQYCTVNDRFTEVEFFTPNQIDVALDVPYAQAVDFQGNLQTLYMDVYFPKLQVDPAQKRPFVLMIHGGGFISGNKQAGDLPALCEGFAQRGFVCASLQYRLGHDNTDEGKYLARYRASQDARAAMRFVVDKANLARIDTAWMFAGGQSAGSFTAHSLVYSDQSEMDALYLAITGSTASSILGDLNTSGNNLTHPFTIKGLFNNWGAVPDNEIDVDEMVPTVAFHGELDQTVFIDIDTSDPLYQPYGSRAMHNLLVQNGVCSELTVDTLGGHGIYRGSAGAAFRVSWASCFFKSVFCNTCSSLYTEQTITPQCATSPPSAKTIVVETDYSAYPNPFSMGFQVEGLQGDEHFVVWDVYGKQVFEGDALEGMKTEQWAGGMYLLKIEREGKEKVLRLVKE